MLRLGCGEINLAVLVVAEEIVIGIVGIKGRFDCVIARVAYRPRRQALIGIGIVSLQVEQGFICRNIGGNIILYICLGGVTAEGGPGCGVIETVVNYR